MTTKAILIVDDDELRCELLAELLRDEGYAVRIANDGVDGLDELEREATDIVLLDIIMPRMDGIRFLQVLPQRIENPPPVLVISGSMDSVGGKTLEEMNVAGTVRKPVDPATLIETIETALSQGAVSSD
ncbi:response regulator [Qipengyuania sp. 1XM1-15A]|uniref:response regulator n=1 Tax=Qipengyuania xiamenensis TaxID=2867237 RepID=UPI001C889FF9|nr:response regulator [Qipengyuania xiamenensis]MBX7533560.1 response regulator [Qipengyuania xiamenensis]